MVVGGPFATEVNLEIVGIQVVGRAMLKASGHREKLLVVYNMELGCKVVGAQVANEANRRRMVTREAQKRAKVSTRAPLGDFVAVLEFGIQDIGWAAKNLCAAQVFAIQASATKELHGSQAAIAPWHVVIKPHSVIHGKWP